VRQKKPQSDAEVAYQKLRSEQWKEGVQEVREGLRDLVVGSADYGRSRLGETRDALRGWLDTPMTIEQRLEDMREWQASSRVEAVDFARRTSEVGYDKGRAMVAYIRAQRMNGLNGQRQSYAPLMLSFHEAKAGEVLSVLPQERRGELVALAERIRDAQLGMLARTRSYADCGQCERYYEGESGGQCCSGWVGQWFRPVDGIFRRLLGERAPVWPRFHHDYSRCGYMGEHGCVLPAGTRPIICVGFYCDPFRERLDKDGVWEAMGAEFAEIRAGLRGLEFRFNTHRRFLGQSGATFTDGSVGYLWNKLMGLYAAFDQLAPSERISGVDAVAEEKVEVGPPPTEEEQEAAAREVLEEQQKSGSDGYAEVWKAILERSAAMQEGEEGGDPSAESAEDVEER